MKHRICINGDRNRYIEIDPEDQMLRLKMFKLGKTLGYLRQQLHESIAEFKAKYDHEADNPSEQCLAEADRRWIDACRKAGQAIDDFFGPGTLQRVFPQTKVPDLYLLEDLMVGILPIIGKMLSDNDAKQKGKENIRPMRFIIQPQDLK